VMVRSSSIGLFDFTHPSHFVFNCLGYLNVLNA
jgi:hypothetical protein